MRNAASVFAGSEVDAVRGYRKSIWPVIQRSIIFLFALALATGYGWAAITVDATVVQDGTSASTTITSPAFSTAAGNEQLLAFISTDYLSGTNTTVKSVTGGGLTWALVKRTNTQSGSAEIWGAFAAAPLSSVTVTATLSQAVISSMTVMSFAGVNPGGAVGAVGGNNAATGAPTASLVTTGNNSVLLGVGNDYDNAIARTVGTGQTLIHQDLTSAGDTYWVQMRSSAIPNSGTTVAINDTAPTQDRYNLSIVEVLAAAGGTTTWSISGTISPVSGGSGATVALSGSSSATTTADANGNYSFSGLSNGSYTVTPTKSGYTFSPANKAITINGANQTGVNFTAQSTATWSISGSISPVGGGSGATVALSGTSSATTTADANGNYSFTGLSNGSYTVTPTKIGYTFSPANQPVTINGANQTGVNFISQAVATWSISGTISPPANGNGAMVALSGTSSATTTADANGNYSFTQLTNGSYTVTPSKSGFSFTPANQPVTVNGANVSNINFTAAAPSGAISRDVTVVQDGAAASTTITSPSFSTAVGNELLLAFISTDYLSGTNTTVKSVSGGGLTWALVKRTNAQSGSAEIWGAFATNKLTGITVSATLSQSIISSITVMSFAGVNPNGAIGAVGSNNATTGAPTASLVTTGNNSLVLGVGNDYDNAIARTVGTGQTLIHQDLTSAGDTYWVQMKSSAIPASGTTVTINDTAPTQDRFNLSIVEVLAATGGTTLTPPTVSMTSPAPGGTVASLVTVSANASDAISVTSVQFLLDGAPLGSALTSPPYTFTWDSTTVADGTHTFAARATNGGGLSTTSTPITITVNNTSDPSVVGQWSSVFNLPAVAVDLILLQNNKVLFYQDGSTATVWDYVQNTFTSVPYSANLFCSGHALLADGRVMVVGGYGGSNNTIGITNAEIFDPVANSWTKVPDMQYRRWYPTATTLSDGRILVTAGWQTSAHTNAGISEIYDPVSNSWTSLTNANNPFETYPFLYLLPDGRVLHIGGSEYATDTDVLDLNTDTWSVVDSTIVDGGSATMYQPNKFMKAGSASDSQESGPSSNTTFVLDMTKPSPTWQQTPSMVYPRSFMNLTMLPDGTTLATGGETDRNGGDISKAVYPAELWSPQTQTWSTMSAMQKPREYHGTALLLPDARVLVSGMGADFGNVPDQKSAQFFSPPYLFKGARPTISQAPTQIQYNSTFFVGTPNNADIGSVVLIRTGAVTHFFDQNERFLPLSFTQAAGGLTVTTPANANLAPPGYYMLFIVNKEGVPSVAPFVQIQ
jgi:hypothetical protein